VITPGPGALENELKAQAYVAPFDAWLGSGFAGTMEYMERHADLRRDSTRPQPGMRSALVVALDYGGREPSGPVARYARGDDYHRLMWDRLDTIGDWLRARAGGGETRAFVDTGPVLERDLARRAGLGWFGKNTLLINPTKGSFFFLGALFTDLELTPDAPFDEDHCGTCTRCLEACPTRAFTAPRSLDSNRCISYLTIEHRGPIDESLRAAIADHVYGCDICQDVCPWNVKFSSVLREPAFAPRPIVGTKNATELAGEILALDEAGYREAFRGSPMKRAKLDGLRRNAEIVLANKAKK
jgi:epoxyqueuosine reductase